MDVGVVCKEAFLSSMEEVGSVVDSGLLTGRATEDLGLPGVTISSSDIIDVYTLWSDSQMAVEVDHADWAILTSVQIRHRSK